MFAAAEGLPSDLGREGEDAARIGDVAVVLACGGGEVGVAVVDGAAEEALAGSFVDEVLGFRAVLGAVFVSTVVDCEDHFAAAQGLLKGLCVGGGGRADAVGEFVAEFVDCVLHVLVSHND